jgi:hypothetical protein
MQAHIWTTLSDSHVNALGHALFRSNIGQFVGEQAVEWLSNVVKGVVRRCFIFRFFERTQLLSHRCQRIKLFLTQLCC